MLLHLGGQPLGPGVDGRRGIGIGKSAPCVVYDRRLPPSRRFETPYPRPDVFCTEHPIKRREARDRMKTILLPPRNVQLRNITSFGKESMKP
jgi:hypothetical protein